ncbi:transposase [Streptomyces noursei]|uniref:transposase n=1 Tax=Streptomyces noursei TaxID=1971 RepID=UPI0023B857CD|nr:transposase [Streptomyces noursei]
MLAACFGPEAEGELPYARRLLSCLNDSMLLLGDAAFDAVEFLREVTATGAQFLVRSSARRRPTIQRRLPDGSYPARLTVPYRAGHGYSTLPARVIEAWIAVTLAEGATRREPWRLVTSLLDHERHPAGELVELCHRWWQAETTYFSIKATMLDGRVLRSRSVPGLNQEVYALLTTYQPSSAPPPTRSPPARVRPWSGSASPFCRRPPPIRSPPPPAYTPPDPTPCSDRSTEWSWTTCYPPRGASTSRPAATRTQRASTGPTQENTHKPPRPTPILSRSTPWNTDLHHTATGKRNGVGLRLPNRSPARAAHHALGDL